MANILFLDGTWSESASVISVARESAASPASNLLLDQPSIVYDSGTPLAPSTFFTVDITFQGSDTGYDGVFLRSWYVTNEAFFVVRTHNQAPSTGGTIVFQSGNVTYHKGPNLSETYTSFDSWYIFPTRRFEPYVRILLYDPFNPAGRIVGGVARIGKIFRPQRNVSFGYGVRPVDPSEFTRTYGSTLHTTERPGYDEMPLPFNFATPTDALNLYRMYKRFGKKHAFWVHLNSDLALYELNSIYGKMEMDEPIIRPDLNIYRLNVTMHEMT